MLAVTVASCILVAYLVWYLLDLTLWAIKAANMTSNIKGPKPWPIIGNALDYIHVSNLEDVYTELIKYFHEHLQPPDRISKIWMGPKLVIAVAEPQYVQAILSNRNAQDKDTKFYDYLALIGNGTFPVNGPRWHELRQPMHGLLNKKSIEPNLIMIHGKALKFCQVISKYVNSQASVDMKRHTTNYALDHTAVFNFGYDLNELEKQKYNVAHNFELALQDLHKLVFKTGFHLNIQHAKLTKPGRDLGRSAQFLWDLANEMLDGREAQKSQGESSKPDYIYADALLETAKKYKLDRNDRGRLCGDFLFGAFDTSSIIMSSAILMLAMHPEHQQAVYEEQLAVVGSSVDVAPTWEQLSKMEYLTRVIRESLRLYGPAFVLRKLKDNVDLGDYKLPSGSTVALAYYALNRDPMLWSHPEQFHPDHFLEEAIASRPSKVYFPFSYGARSCPGSLYATTAMKMLLSTAIRYYKFETDMKFEDMEYHAGLLLESRNGYHVRIKPRSATSAVEQVSNR